MIFSLIVDLLMDYLLILNEIGIYLRRLVYWGNLKVFTNQWFGSYTNFEKEKSDGLAENVWESIWSRPWL